MARPRPVERLDRREFPVLYVDDEPENLRAFELSFRREFTILTANSADAGMAVLSENPLAVVLSDHKMPGVTGVEFLARVREFDPKVVRMLVTAYGDAETLGHAINDGCIYRYIPKPWEPDDMRLALRQAIDLYALDRERETLLDELHLLARLSRSLYRELNVDRLFETLLDAIHDQLGFDGAALLLVDETGDALHWQGMRPGESEVGERIASIRIDRENAPEFLEQIELGAVQTLTSENMSEVESPIRTWITEVSAQQLLVVPMNGSKGPLGAIAIDNRRGGRRFGSNDRTLLGGLAAQAVVAIENARLVEALRISRAGLRRAERLGTFGILARDLASEMHPSLVSVQSFVSLAPQKRDSEDAGFWENAHGQVSSELDRMRQRLAAIDLLGRDDARSTRTTTDVGPLVSQVVGVLEPVAQHRDASFDLQIEEGLPPALGTRSELRQVLLSIGLVAARRAEAHSTIELKVRRVRECTPSGIELSLRGRQIAPDREGAGAAAREVCREIVEECGGIFEDHPNAVPPSVRIVLPEGSVLD